MDLISLNSHNHNSNLVNSLDHFKAVNSFVDVTLVCEGHTVKAHKIILSAGSNVLHRLLLANPAKHPIIILTETKYDTLRMVMDFLYKGRIDIPINDLKKLLAVAVTFEINELKILCEENLKAYNVPNMDPCPQSPSLNGSSPKRKRQCTQSSDSSILYEALFPKREISSPWNLEQPEVSPLTDTLSASEQTECVGFHPQIADTRSLNRTSVQSSTETVASSQNNQKKDASTECDIQPLKELESNLVPTEPARVIARPRRIELTDIPDTKKLPNRKRRSKIWGYYTTMSDSYAACKLCGRKLSYKTTVSNLKKHLQTSHKQFDPVHPPKLPDVPVLRIQSDQLEIFEEIDFNSVEEEIAAEDEEQLHHEEEEASDESIPSTSTPCILKIT